MPKSTICVVHLLVLLAGSCCSALATTTAEVKLLPDGQSAGLTGKVVTYAAADFLYVEDDNRSCGIRVDKSGHGLQRGMRADVVGDTSSHAYGINNSGEAVEHLSLCYLCEGLLEITPPDTERRGAAREVICRGGR